MRAKREVSAKEQSSARGNCYEAAMVMVLSAQMPMVLCHGTVTGQGPVEGIRFGHAWAEWGGLVFDDSEGRVVMPIEQYYAMGEIDPGEVRRYTRKEAAAHMLKAGHYGPDWNAKPRLPGADTIRPRKRKRHT